MHVFNTFRLQNLACVHSDVIAVVQVADVIVPHSKHARSVVDVEASAGVSVHAQYHALDLSVVSGQTQSRAAPQTFERQTSFLLVQSHWVKVCCPFNSKIVSKNCVKNSKNKN